MMNTFYLFDDTKNYIGKVEADIQPTDSTAIAVPPGTLSARFNGTEWVNVEIDAGFQNANSQGEALSQLALQQAQFQVSQQKLNSQLALQLAQLTAKEGK